MSKNPVITRIGEARGSIRLSNEDLISRTGIRSTDAFIRRATGIEQRFWVDGEVTSDLASTAIKSALAGSTSEDISALYLATASGDQPTPSTSSIVHEKAGLPRECAAIDINAACAGGVLAVEQAALKLYSRPDSRVLAVGAEVLSRWLSDDRKINILFGDGAGAAVLEMQEGADQPFFSATTHPSKAVETPAGGTANPGGDINDPLRKIHMDGKEVSRQAPFMMVENALNVARQAKLYDKAKGIDWSQIDYFVPHQANGVLLQGLGDYLQVPEEKRVVTVNEVGNTSAASIFQAISIARERGQIEAGRKRMLTTAVGAGFVSAAAIIDLNLS